MSSNSEKNFATFLALLGLLILAGGMISLITMILPQFLWVIIVFLGFALMIAFHYFTWGRWLSNQNPHDDEQDE